MRFLRDLRMVAKATVSNLMARFVPQAYVRLTHQTGRGADESPQQVADYFLQCLEDYRCRLVLQPGGILKERVHGKHILEYGPGDTLGVALLLFANGAQHVECVDRFAMESVSPTSVEVYRLLLQALPKEQRERAALAFRTTGDPSSGFDPRHIRYRVTDDGLAGRDSAYDLILSRAVLEHVNSLPATVRDIERGLKPGGLSLHCVDLRSHNLDRDSPLDFLTWPDWTYRLMYSHKGFPNRWRVGHYRELVKQSALELELLEPTEVLGPDQVKAIASRVAPSLRQDSLEDLSWLGFWMQLRKPAPSVAVNL